MKTILSLIIFIILLYWIGLIYFSNKKKFRIVKYGNGESYLLSRNMYFVMFTVCTAPVFLGSLSLLKYGLWFTMILLLLFTAKIRAKFEATTIMYLIFFLWLCYTMTYTSVPRDGLMMLVKFLLPIQFLWLGYSAINNEKELIIFLKIVNVIACIWCLVIGGFSATFIPPLYHFAMGIFSTYAAFADYLTSIFIAPILLYWLTKEKKYILCALWMVLSTVLQSVRTGMGGMMLVFVVAILLHHKWKAVPGVLFAGALFLGTILFVPEVNEKFFGDKAGTVTSTDIIENNALSLDNIDTNGRNYTWEHILEKFYIGKESTGSGLGTAIRYLKDKWRFENEGAGLIHNDYVQLLAETGYIGVALLILFYIFMIIKVISYVLLRRTSSLTNLTGIMALSSMAGIAFCMYFDNVVSTSMQSMIMPYIYLGFFLKAIDLDRKNNINQVSSFKNINV